MKRAHALLAIAISAALFLSSCATASNTNLSASGMLSAREVPIASEISGRVVEVNVEEGQAVKKGDMLFRIDSELLQAQYDQAKSAADAAEATLQAAQAQLVYAQSQYDLTLQGARLQDLQARQNRMGVDVPTDYRPAWYFQTDENIAAAQAEVDAAAADLVAKQADLKAELKKASNQDFVAAEQRLAQAQIAYSVAEETDRQADLSSDEVLKDAAQESLDAADSDLKTARLAYEQMLTSAAADAVETARARVAVAQARYDNARDALLHLQTGDESIQVKAAKAGVTQAQAAVMQAEANMAQAKAALALVQLQLERAEIKAPMDGVVLARNLEPGEIAAAGGTVMSIGELKDMKLVVYIPETQYGQIHLGQDVNITVDSFPGQVFMGKVLYISDQAEFTPRNVQTVDGRKSTVYAVEIKVPNGDSKLKAGMPADVVFIDEG